MSEEKVVGRVSLEAIMGFLDGDQIATENLRGILTAIEAKAFKALADADEEEFLQAVSREEDMIAHSNVSGAYRVMRDYRRKLARGHYLQIAMSD